MADTPRTGEFSPMTLKLAALCDQKCPVCVKAREKGSGFLYGMVKLEGFICPACRAYKKVYGVPAHLPRPAE